MYLEMTPRPVAAPARSELAEERPVAIPCAGDFLTGSLAAPRAPRGCVIIANDRGCARHIPELRAMARELRAAGFATLMVDVLPAQDLAPAVAVQVRRETGLLAERIAAARALLAKSRFANLPVVLFGMGGAAPAALLSAAAHPAGVAAVVACGSSPDAAGVALEKVSVPTLLIAHDGQFDDLGSHMRALGRLGGERDLVVLHELDDPFKRALDIARSAVAFLSPVCAHACKAA